MGKYREQVERGAAFLDEETPRWRDRIDLRTLELASPCGCVLGQLFGNYYDTVRQFGWRDAPEPVEYGFSLVEHGEEETGIGRPEDWDELTAEWRDYIRETRTAVTA